MASAVASGQKGHACHHCGTVPARHMMVVPNTKENFENAKACQMPHWRIAYDPANPHVLEVPLCEKCRDTFKKAYSPGEEQEETANAARTEEEEVQRALLNSLCDFDRKGSDEATYKTEEEELLLAIGLSLEEARRQAEEELPPQQQSSEPTSTPRSC